MDQEESRGDLIGKCCARLNDTRHGGVQRNVPNKPCIFRHSLSCLRFGYFPAQLPSVTLISGTLCSSSKPCSLEWYDLICSKARDALEHIIDSICHELLIAKLHAYGLVDNSVKLINSYLHCRLQRVKLNGNFSNWRTEKRGPAREPVGPSFLQHFY